MVHSSISLLWRRKIGREKECKCRFSFILNIVFGKKWHLNPISIVEVNFSSLSLRLYCNIFRECRFSLINRRCIETEFYEADLGLFRTCSLILLWKRVKKKKKKSVDWFIIHTEEGRGGKKRWILRATSVYTHIFMYYYTLAMGYQLLTLDHLAVPPSQSTTLDWMSPETGPIHLRQRVQKPLHRTMGRRLEMSRKWCDVSWCTWMNDTGMQ